MKTLLILTDFSDVAAHAAEYACRLSLQFKSEKIILLNAYNAVQPVAQQPLTTIADKEVRQEVSGKMDKMKMTLQALTNPYTEIKFTTELTGAFEKLCKNQPLLFQERTDN